MALKIQTYCGWLFNMSITPSLPDKVGGSCPENALG